MLKYDRVDWDEMQYFTAEEFRCKCGCDRTLMDADFIALLDELRAKLNFPMRVSSGFRCPKHNKAVSSTGATGPHTTGKAVDILISGEQAWKLVQAAMDVGVSGLGVRQKGSHSGRFIHLDVIKGSVRPRVWSY